MVQGRRMAASVVGWWTSWAAGHTPLCRASTLLLSKLSLWLVSVLPKGSQELELGRDAHNGLLELFPLMPALHSGDVVPPGTQEYRGKGHGL